ncbi:MAG: M50 family metallopeptidase [Candidatus Nealsonbacteria bacterium]
MLTILLVFFSIIALVSLHEFGHFIIAKKFNVKVDEFGIGYPPRIIGKKIGETLYSLNLLPFGAFVKILGEEGGAEGVEDNRNFSKKPVWQRTLILLGGVASFWLIATLLLSFVFGTGVSQSVEDDAKGALNPKIQVSGVSNDSPADLVGIKPGDIISGFYFSGVFYPVDKIKEFQEFIEEQKGKEITVLFNRGNEAMEFSLIPRISPPVGEGAMGVDLLRVAEVTYSWWQAPVMAVKATFNLTMAVISIWFSTSKSLLAGQGLPGEVQFLGPIGIGSVLNQAAQVGINYFLQLIALLAVYLAVLNLLPIPALDGGRVVFLVIEKIKGSPINKKIEQSINSAFFFLMIGLMVWVTVKDIANLF